MTARISPSQLFPCFVCETPTTKRCSKCQDVFYCSVTCQRMDWPLHKSLYCNKRYVSHLGPEISPNDTIVLDLLSKVLANNQGNNFFLSRRTYRLTSPPENLQIVPNTRERVLMWMTIFAFPKNNQFFDKFADLSSVKILKKETHFDTKNPHDCSWFIFKKEHWYVPNKRPLQKVLFGPYQNASQFLQEKGYAQTEIPRAGNIVVYATNVYGSKKPRAQFQVSHYGKIVDILEDRSIVVHSKFGHGHTYEHRLERIPFFLGNAYTFFSKSSDS